MSPLVAAALLLIASAACAAEPSQTVILAGETGPYTVERWKRDWPGCQYEDGVKEGRIEIVRRDEQNVLRITCQPGQIGPSKGGAGWRWPVEPSEVMALSYVLRFDPDFEFVKGGKLPGLSGGPESVTGGRPADGTNGFSARLMWRRDGRGEAYVYHRNQRGKYGDSFRFPEDFRFPRGTPIGVRIETTMNRPGHNNGSLRVWISVPGEAEQLVVDRHDLVWRTIDTFAVDSVQFEVFHGGDDASWAPSKPSALEIGKIQLTRGK